MQKDDYSWVRGANYIPSWGATNVQTWRDFDAEVLDRELGYAERIGLNSLRVNLQYYVYKHHREDFLKNVATFVDLCDKHGIRPMLTLFDSCFGTAPSADSCDLWVPSPGPHLTNPEFYPEGERYIRELVELFRDDPRVLMWDVMNEPDNNYIGQTPEGRQQIWDFVRHFCDFVHEIDKCHPITVGVPANDSSEVIDHIDVVSMHSYNTTEEGLRNDIAESRQQADAADKPLVITECCAQGWGSTYEMAMPVIYDEGIGFYVWELMIAQSQFAPITGLFYPDGTVRQRSNIAAVTQQCADNFEEKPDSEGIPLAKGPNPGQLLGGVIERFKRIPCNEDNYPERWTFLAGMSRHFKFLGDKNESVSKALDDIQALKDNGKTEEAYAGLREQLATVESVLKALEDGRLQ